MVVQFAICNSQTRLVWRERLEITEKRRYEFSRVERCDYQNPEAKEIIFISIVQCVLPPKCKKSKDTRELVKKWEPQYTVGESINRDDYFEECFVNT